MKLELVTDFAALKGGDHVVLMPCGCCGSSHESRLGGTGVAANGRVGFELLPPPSCLGGEPMLCTSLAVQNRRVYRLVDGTESAAETRERKAVRA